MLISYPWMEGQQKDKQRHVGGTKDQKVQQKTNNQHRQKDGIGLIIG